MYKLKFCFFVYLVQNPQPVAVGTKIISNFIHFKMGAIKNPFTFSQTNSANKVLIWDFSKRNLHISRNKSALKVIDLSNEIAIRKLDFFNSLRSDYVYCVLKFLKKNILEKPERSL